MRRPISLSTLAALILAATLLQAHQVESASTDYDTTPVAGSFTAFLTQEGTVILRWVIDPGCEPDAINIYRGTGREGPFEIINPEPLEPVSPGVYIDDTLWPGGCFWYELWAWYSDGCEFGMRGSPAYISTGGSLPIALLPPRPNPAPGTTRIVFDVPDVDAPVELSVYNARGQRVKTLVRDPMEPGPHGVDWNCVDSCGSQVAGGVYFVRLRIGAEERIGKILVVR
jgi:hypothetical protein